MSQEKMTHLFGIGPSARVKEGGLKGLRQIKQNEGGKNATYLGRTKKNEKTKKGGKREILLREIRHPKEKIGHGKNNVSSPPPATRQQEVGGWPFHLTQVPRKTDPRLPTTGRQKNAKE